MNPEDSPLNSTVPRGLEYLVTLDQLIVKQQIEILEGNNQGILTGVGIWVGFGLGPKTQKNPVHYRSLVMTSFFLFFRTFLNDNINSTFIVLTGFEGANKYKVLNSMGQQAYFAIEQNNCCQRLVSTL